MLGQEAPELKEFEVSRPAGLGLGAKYLPHHKVRLRFTTQNLLEWKLHTQTPAQHAPIPPELLCIAQVAGISNNVERHLGKRLHQLADGQAASQSAQPKRAKAESHLPHTSGDPRHPTSC